MVGRLKEERMKDVEIAINEHGWQWVNMHGIRDILLPPEDDPRRFWTSIWTEDGIPHYLPRYSQGEK